MLLNIEPGLIIWTVITFVILLIVLRKVAWGPVLTALEQREHTIRSALEEAQRLIEIARREIGRERQLAMQELKNTAADLALAAAGRLLNTSMTSEDHRRLVTEFLDHFPERIEG